MFKEIISLIYPHLCVSCGKSLHRAKWNICLSCRSTLPSTGFANQSVNPVMKLLWGKAEFSHASSCFYFRKKGKMQKLIHALKYKGNTKLGVELGKLMSKELMLSSAYKKIDLIVPLPLHPSKKMLRGYNQCDFLAEGISELMEKPVEYNGLRRIVATSSQTKKDHFERHRNVDQIFEIEKPEKFKNRTVLLVDDVITTGSTLASCAHELNKIENCKTIICTTAIAS